MASDEPVEVFKTNIPSFREAQRLRDALLRTFPWCRINFDLHDCDRILRMEGRANNAQVIRIARRMGLAVEVLPD